MAKKDLVSSARPEEIVFRAVTSEAESYRWYDEVYRTGGGTIYLLEVRGQEVGFWEEGLSQDIPTLADRLVLTSADEGARARVLPALLRRVVGDPNLPLACEAVWEEWRTQTAQLRKEAEDLRDQLPAYLSNFGYPREDLERLLGGGFSSEGDWTWDSKRTQGTEIWNPTAQAVVGTYVKRAKEVLAQIGAQERVAQASRELREQLLTMACPQCGQPFENGMCRNRSSHDYGCGDDTEKVQDVIVDGQKVAEIWVGGYEKPDRGKAYGYLYILIGEDEMAYRQCLPNRGG